MANYDFGTPITITPINTGFTGVCDTSAIISGTESFAPTTGSFWRIATGQSASAASYSINVTASGSSAYTLSGTDRNGAVSGNNVNVDVNVGDTISFAVNASGHPFYLRVSNGGVNVSTPAATNQGAVSGTVSWTPNTAGTYYYQCGNHSGMVGTITVSASASDSATSYTSGSAFAQDFQSTTPPSPITWVQDDSSIEVTPPFSITFDGVSYSSFYIGSNGYITFGGGSSDYNNLSASVPSLRKVMINSQDLRSRSYGFDTYGTSGSRTFLVSYSGNILNDEETRLNYYLKMYEDPSLDGIIDYYILNNDFRYSIASNFNDGTGTAVTIPGVSATPSSVSNIVFTPTTSIYRLTTARVPVDFSNLSNFTGPTSLSYPGRRPGQGQLYPRGVYNK